MRVNVRSLNRKQANAVIRAIRKEGKQPPKVGWCVKALGGEVCRHPKSQHLKGDTGYQAINIEQPEGFAGHRRQR